VPQEVLQAPRIHSFGRQGVARRVPQHVDVYRERQLSGLSSAFYHAGDAHPAKGLAALIHEDVSGLGLLLAL
jgi:hypothetical protein